MTTESKILSSARKIFLLYGYHGATMQRIAELAGVNKTVIHYYYRSKEKLYERIIVELIPIIFSNKISIENKFDYIWFIISELRNNRSRFITIYNKTALVRWSEAEEKSIAKKVTEFKPKEIKMAINQ